MIWARIAVLASHVDPFPFFWLGFEKAGLGGLVDNIFFTAFINKLGS